MFPVGVRILQLQECVDRDGLWVASNCDRLHRRTRTYNLMTHIVDTRTLHHNAIIGTLYGKLEFQFTQSTLGNFRAVPISEPCCE